jgi:hypothetical protein
MSLPGRDRHSLDAEIDDLAFAEPDWNGSGQLALRPDHLILGNLRRTNADRAGIEGRRFSGLELHIRLTRFPNVTEKRGGVSAKRFFEARS